MKTTTTLDRTTDQTLADLKARLAAVSDLYAVEGLLGWDQQTIMPPKGAAVRAEQLATVARLAHERFVDDEIGQWLEDLRPYEESLPADADDASLIRVARRDYEKIRRVPGELLAELVRAASQGFGVWVEAKDASDFERFRPSLERMLDLKRQYIACFEPAACAYDVLLDDYEPGMTTAEVRAVFGPLREALKPLVARVGERPDAVDDACFYGHFPAEEQRRFMLALLPKLGYDPEGMRLDTAPHPFASGIAPSDVRLTTRFDESYLATALFGTIHECGHGLYEAGIDPALGRGPLGNAVSLALHESQSRLWENVVGRGQAFWHFAFPLLREHFPTRFGSVAEETVFRAANRMRPSLIRVEADELTYPMHIILRFEIEQDLIDGRLAVADLPAAWNDKMRDYLGVEPPDDAHGVLQDVHWADGLIGYFPTYLLGSIIAVQVWERVRVEMPDVEEQFARGEFLSLRDWLREHLHRHGRKFTAKETIELVAGGPLDSAPFVRYITEKVETLYR
ncbi:MAG: carboxypeptidase M32 [Thermomicrobiales bacterium]